LYEELPTNLLAGFYFEILKNINMGILSENMYSELELIETATASRGITLEVLLKIYNTETQQLIANANKNKKNKRMVWITNVSPKEKIKLK
jgi:hypothetical protein